jgi:hypothetical protein
MIEKFLKLSRGLAGATQLGLGQTTHVDWIEGSEEGGASEVGGTWDREVVRRGGLRHFERCRRARASRSKRSMNCVCAILTATARPRRVSTAR